VRRAHLTLLVFCMFAVLGVSAAPASAAVPCWKQVVNDWYVDGKIASTYPIHCYKDAYGHLKTDELVYSSLGDDIHRALAAAVARKAGKKVPAQVGRGFAAVHARLASAQTPERSATADRAAAQRPVGDASSSSSSPVPVPLLVLGGVAIVLIAVGSVGAVVRRRRTL
jgi:hypothetical protein